MSNEELNRMREAIRIATHFLPAQGPISIFVHHNTLHSFEDLPFREAVLEGAARYGCQPYLSERRYHAELEKGRISVKDLRQVLLEDLGDYADTLIASFGTSYTLRLAILQMHLHTAPDAELTWLLAETDLLRRFRSDVSPARRDRVIQRTQNWILGNLTSDPGRGTSSKLPKVVHSLIEERSGRRIDLWSDPQWEEFSLQLLWRICAQGVHAAASLKCLADEQLPHASSQAVHQRLRDHLLQVSNEDIDQTVNEVFIRFCGAFLDQGFATWTLPEREQGFAHAFAKLYLQRMTVRPDWMRHLRPDLQKVLAADFDPLQSIHESLEAMGVDTAVQEEVIAESLLALRGWAGMLWQMESKPEFHPYPAPAGTLEEYLAVRLILEKHAIADLGERIFDSRDISTIRAKVIASLPATTAPSPQQQTYTVFQLAEANGWTPEELTSMTQPQWACLLKEISDFHSLERRRILHQAYERHYSVASLDAISLHSQRRRQESTGPSKPSAYAAIFCIDDREESFRRHLEEVDPECVTAGAAGFYAVAMYYRGTDHANFRPLCPASITPTHFVQEESVFSAIDTGERRAIRRRRIGKFQHQMHSHSRTLVGGWVTGLFGAMATFPMIARILAPRLTARIRESMATFTRPPATELHLERVAAEPGPEGDALGYSITEMAGIVRRILEDLGMVADFPPIIVFFGHGSGSLNNPHESAYSCGACSGGRGGPNARAFAVMANDPRVRRILVEQGLEIPEEIRFVGAFHNTCNDKVDYYDVDLLPRSHRSLFRRIEQSVNETRARNAHERARRFESAALDLSTTAALEHVEQRAEDLSQARPEYNHATNAVMVVGGRDWTRGLFMDRRVFLTSYDPAIDSEDCPVLTRILQAAIPVCAGISLEYYFSTVDTEGYGCGSKLPHNVTSMLGVMTGAASDLRPGLSQQMVEIHEAMRILCVIETTPEKMLKIIAANPPIGRLVRGEWVSLAVIDSSTGSIQRYVQGRFEPYLLESNDLPQLESSLDWYRGNRDHMGYASIRSTTPNFQLPPTTTRRPSP